MFGLIHECFRQMIVEKLGNAAWEEIMRMAGFESGKENIINHHYTDRDTYVIAECVAQLTLKRKEEVWEWFGRYFVKFAINAGYENLFKCMSPNLKEFLNNLDPLHYFVDHIIYKANLNGPSFRCEDGEDGSILLHYFSSRNALYPIVKGIIEEIALQVYGLRIEMIFLGRTQRSIQLTTHEKIEEHVTFLIRQNKSLTPQSATSVASFASADMSSMKTGELRLRPADIMALLPYHLIVDRDSQLVAFGNGLSHFVSSHFLKKGTLIVKIFRPFRPQIPLDFENICNFINAVYVLEIRSLARSSNVDHSERVEKFDESERETFAFGKQNLMLKGQMVMLSDRCHLAFLCTPYASSPYELSSYGLYLNQIPAFDVSRDLILLNQQRLGDVEVNLQLEANTNQLESMAKDLLVEKSISDALLKEVLPASVAAQLLEFSAVDAREYSEATVMFCDVPNFQEIVGHSTPTEIVQILNDLYIKFDELVGFHNVYKVETVGETYMTVAGVPEFESDHCEKICHVALGMLWEARSVLDPATRQPLRVRCGIHTGNVVAGVVGIKMPRYCLFGDTVNTSARMESHSLPGRIHCTSDAKLASLRAGRFEYKSRGLIPIKGKGLMHTSFLVRSLKKSIFEITGRKRDENLHTIDGYEELLEGIENDLFPPPKVGTAQNPCCFVS